MPGSSAFGRGGAVNAYPGRGLPEYGSEDDSGRGGFGGGARGPAALPSRTTVANGPAAPEPLIGAHGTISYHRGDFIEDAAAPRLYFDGVYDHGAVPWRRPTYANAAGRLGYHAPTHRTSWTANDIAVDEVPRSPIPVQNKRITNFTVRRPFGDTSTGQLFNGKSLADYVASIMVGMDQQGRRWLSQAKTKNPWQPNLSSWGAAGSYGQTTTVLDTAPANTPASYNQYGAY